MYQKNIKIYKTFTDEFCTKMCKFFADTSIIKELDNQLYSNEDMLWFIFDDGVVKGFLSIENKIDYYYIDNFYVIKQYRNADIGNCLLDKVLQTFKDKPIKLITRNDIALNMYLKRNFKVYRTNGRYFYLIKKEGEFYEN